MSLGLLLLLAGFGMAVSVAASRKFPRVWLVLVLFSVTTTLIAAVQVLVGGATWEWRHFVGNGRELAHLRLDGLSAFFLALLGVVGGAGAVFASEYWHDRSHPRSAPANRAWWSVLLTCLALVLMAANGLHFLIAWEVFTVAAFFLVTLDRQSGEVRAAGWLFLGASHAAALCLFAFFTILAARTGSWELGPLRDHPELAPLFWLALAGFGLKAGMFPLHIWLPSAHANAPSHVSAILSGVTIKMGIYGLVRFSGWLPMPPAAGWVVAALGVVSALLGVAFALGQHDLKRLLAYHSVENIGIMLIGIGFAMVAVDRGGAAWGRLALAGGLLHVWNHGLFKSLLFFGAGSVFHATGTREMSKLGGLWRGMPWTAGLFGLGAVAIAGLPPLNGFVSEWLVYLGLFDAVIGRGPAAWAAIPAAILLGVTGALALACFVKACGVVFLGAPRSKEADRARESGVRIRAAMLVTAAGCVAIGLLPVLFLPAVDRAVGVWLPAWSAERTSVPLAALGRVHLALASFALVAGFWLWRLAGCGKLKRAPTWDCGYAAPAARMQYTAGSFAGIITEWFAWILRPVRHEHRPEGAFPADASFTQHTPETVLDCVLTPAGRGVMQVAWAARALHRGRVQAYLFYLLLSIAGLAILAFLGGD